MTVKKAVEPTFADLVTDLASADAEARVTSANASESRERRSTVAVDAIKAAYTEKIDSEVVRETLLASSILKGTVSKIVTILDALRDHIISPGDISSLNGAYISVKAARAIAAGAVSTALSGVPFSTTAPPVVATTPEEALKIILDSIKSITDPDEQLKAVGEWITKTTNALTSLAKSITDGDEEEE